MVVVDPVRESVAILVAAYPEARLDPKTPDVYVRALDDLEANDLRDAVMTLIATSRRFPTVAELRETVVERRLALPAGIEAWELVAAYAGEPARYELCPDCGGRGWKDADAEVACPCCRAEGRVEVGRQRRYDRLPPPARRALQAVGGSGAIQGSDSEPVIRAQFLKAYDVFRRQAVTDENLGSAGLALTRRETPAALIEGRTR